MITLTDVFRVAMAWIANVVDGGKAVCTAVCGVSRHVAHVARAVSRERAALVECALCFAIRLAGQL